MTAASGAALGCLHREFSFTDILVLFVCILSIVRCVCNLISVVRMLARLACVLCIVCILSTARAVCILSIHHIVGSNT